MYLCNCKGINERRVKAAIMDGAHHVAGVFHHCGEKPQCARCVHRIAALIRAERSGRLLADVSRGSACHCADG